MGKMAMLRYLIRSPSAVRSSRCAAVSTSRSIDGWLLPEDSRSFFTVSRPSTSSAPRSRVFSDTWSPFASGIGSTRFFCEDVTHFPDIKDHEIKNIFKDFIAANWNELPDPLIHDAKKVLSKDTDDKTGKEALANVFRSAEAVEEFTGILVSLKMELDDSVGLSGEDVKPLSEELVNALHTVHSRYTTYLDSFGPDELYLRKKVETELGTRMIHLKMRCSGIGSEWGKVTVLGTSGLSGSYVEQRAP
ncbi:membrane anchor in succinate dehydrogenase complex [Dionaea muscipula]